jgi:hypothetical protein
MRRRMRVDPASLDHATCPPVGIHMRRRIHAYEEEGAWIDHATCPPVSVCVN